MKSRGKILVICLAVIVACHLVKVADATENIAHELSPESRQEQEQAATKEQVAFLASQKDGHLVDTNQDVTKNVAEEGAGYENNDVSEMTADDSNVSYQGSKRRGWGAADSEIVINDEVVEKKQEESGMEYDENEERSELNGDTVEESKIEAATNRSFEAGHEQHMKEDGNKRLWGSTTGSDIHHEHSNVKKDITNGIDEPPEVNSTSIQKQHPHIPFVATKGSHNYQQHNPPEGFTFAGRVYVDPSDALAHFDYKDESRHIMKGLTIPYWDCGVTGSTTSPLRVKDAYFRNALGASTSWKSIGGLNPVLVIALSPSLLELNSGESLFLRPGDAVLLEDAIRPGHRFSPSDTNTKASDMKLLFLTLPKPHYHVGKEYLSIKEATTTIQKDPCPDFTHIKRPDNLFDDQEQADIRDMHLSNPDAVEEKQKLSPTVTIRSNQFFWDTRRLQLFVLGTIGMSLSTLAADFIGRTAPLWLAVGIGGTFFVGFGTFGFTIVSDRLIQSIQLWRERKRLMSTGSHHRQLFNNEK